jgi:Tol biopolymer transport system component
MTRALLIPRLRLLTGALAASAFIALAVAGTSGPAAGATSAGRYWIVLGSNRDGVTRAYSVRPDGSRLTMLLPATLGSVTPEAVSHNGRTIAYQVDGFDDPLEQLSVSRANGTGLRPLVRALGSAVLSPNGKMVAYTSSRLFVIRSDGKGRRRLSSRGEAYAPDWSPDGRTVVYDDESRSPRAAIVVQPLRGRSYVVARGEVSTPKWSPDGRWIAYAGKHGLALVRPNGTGTHIAARGPISSFAWSPNGRKLAFGTGARGKLVVVSREGGAPRRIHLRGAQSVASLSWSPDGRFLAVQDERYDVGGQIWVVGVDGRAPRVVAHEGSSTLVGWSRLAPAQPPAPALLPSEWALGPDTVATRTPISDLSADGGRVAFVLGWTGADCEHVAVWTPAAQVLNRFRKPSTACDGGVYSVELSGSRAAWVSYSGCGNFCDVTLETATLDDPAPLAVAYDSVNANEPLEWPLRGDGDLLVFDEGERLVRLGTGAEKCEKALCTTLRRGAHSAPVESVSGGLIAVLEASAVAVVDGHGALVTVIPFAQNEVKAARLDGGHLIVARSGVLQVYDAASGAALQQRPLPAGYSLTDVDGGIVVLQHHETITLMRLEDGRSLTLAPGRGPVLADLEPAGLYYSYVTDEGGGRVVFVPRSNLLQAMGA